jgi:hypothetical protein
MIKDVTMNFIQAKSLASAGISQEHNLFLPMNFFF